MVTFIFKKLPLFFFQMSDQNGEIKKHENEEEEEETPLNVDVEDAKEEEEELRYGWGRFRPKCLQFLNNPKCFVVALALFSFIQGKDNI